MSKEKHQIAVQKRSEFGKNASRRARRDGLVPVIADSPRSATPQFALDGRSLFPAGDTDALAERIDWWIEHPDERREMERCYAEHAKGYSLENSILQTEEMFRQAIAEQRGTRT